MELGQHDVDLFCPVCIHPPYTESDIYWTFEEKELPPLVVKRGRKLAITTVQESHFGTYTCALEQRANENGETKKFSLHLIKDGEPLYL